MGKQRIICAIAVAASLALAAPAAAATTESQEFDITRVTARDLVVDGRATCFEIPVAHWHDHPPWQEADTVGIQYEVHRGQTQMHSGSSFNDPPIDGRVTGTYNWCNGAFGNDPLGTITIGPNDVSGFDSQPGGGPFEFTDTTTGQFQIKQRSVTGDFATRRDRRLVGLTCTVVFFSVRPDSFVFARDYEVFVQRRRVDGSWATLGFVRTNRKGRAVAVVRSRRVSTWRMVTAETSTIWASRTAPKRR